MISLNLVNTDLNCTLWLLLLFILGAVIGSFLNVCIHRIPRDESIVAPGSRCPQCLTFISWKDKVPLISYIFLKGRCRHCHATIPLRYWIVELLTAILFVVTGFLLDPLLAVAGMFFVSLLVGASFIDLEHFIIPDFFTFWGALLGIIFSAVIPQLHLNEMMNIAWIDALRASMQSILGILLGSAIGLWSMLLGEKFFGKEAFGFGDVLLLGMIGSFIGWQGAIFSLFGGSCLASVILIPLMILEKFSKKRWLPRRVVHKELEVKEDIAVTVSEEKKIDENFIYKENLETKSVIKENSDILQWGVAVPFGPFLAASAIIYFLFLKNFLNVFFKNIAFLFY